jgi:hypothetical protein
MIIISDFHDYYDVLISKDSLIYHRKTTEEYIKFPFKLSKWNHYLDNRDFYSYIVGFCGEIFSVIQERGTFYFSQEEINCPRPLEYYEKYKIHYIGFNIPESIKAPFYQFFNFKTPIWFIQYPDRYEINNELKLTRNPRLVGTGFVNHFGIYETFQKIETYLGSIAFPENNIPKVSDLDMIEAKGFDKYSFRREKSTSHKRRKRV